jgi:hypothetical protein
VKRCQFKDILSGLLEDITISVVFFHFVFTFYMIIKTSVCMNNNVKGEENYTFERDEEIVAGWDD